jgi:predicted nucleotidyltransferase
MTAGTTARSLPQEQVLARMVRDIVAEAHPLRIVLFGSAAREAMGPHSDLDLRVVMPNGAHRRETTRRLYRALYGLGLAADIIVVTEEDVRRFAGEPSLVICPALEEGRELYHAG